MEVWALLGEMGKRSMMVATGKERNIQFILDRVESEVPHKSQEGRGPRKAIGLGVWKD